MRKSATTEIRNQATLVATEGHAPPPGAKFLIVSVLGLFFSFGIGHVSRFVPGLRVLLGTTPRHAEPAGAPGEGTEAGGSSAQNRVTPSEPQRRRGLVAAVRELAIAEAAPRDVPCDIQGRVQGGTAA